MRSVNIVEAMTTLSRLVEAIELGEEREIVIERNGLPVARLVPVDALLVGPRLGVATGLFEVPDNINAHSDEVAKLFAGNHS